MQKLFFSLHFTVKIVGHILIKVVKLAELLL